MKSILYSFRRGAWLIKIRGMTVAVAASAVGSLALHSAYAAADTPAAAAPKGANLWSPPAQVGPDAKPGDIFWMQQRADAPVGSTGWNVIYVSEVTPGQLKYVSGEIYAPSSKVAEPRDVVLWNHPTAGNADSCAPSRRELKTPTGASRVPAIEELLSKGYVVAMSDYPGLGLPGPTYYMAGEPNARASLDVLKAVQNVPELNASKRYVMYGWSQGGQTTLWAGSIAKSYAPGFSPLGSALIAPAGRILDLTLNSMRSTTLAGYVIATLPGIHSLFPTLKYGDFLTTEGLEQFPAIADGCFDVFATAAKVKAPYQKKALVPGSPWFTALQKVDSFTSVADIPVLIFQGTVDEDTPVKLTSRLRTDLCVSGAKVDYRQFQGLDHRTVVPEAAAVLPGWIESRFKGDSPASNCGS
ncbi:UNVERIFIED_ORG: putative esterase [Variovorax paradoxus]|nr:putative esterase [Variovorax paradoxus]